MVRESLDLLIIILIVAAEFILGGLGAASGPIGIVFGVLLALFLPGYALSAAVFGRRPVLSAERAALTLGISLSVAILGGLVLDALPGGLNLQSWLLLLGGVTIAAALFAMLRPAPTTTSPEAGSRTASPPGLRLTPTRATVLAALQRASLRPILLGGLTVIVLVGGITIAVNGAQRQQSAGAVTQLWLLPDKTTPTTLHLGIHTESAQPAEYLLTLSVNGKLYESWEPISLTATDTWQTSVTAPSPTAGGDVQVEANLYRTDQPGTVFRHVSLVLSSSGAALISPPPERVKGT